jgi:hypothetical protein
MITVTFYWWMVPIMVLVGSCAAACVAERNNSGGMFYMPILGPLWVLGGLIAAVALVLGHFL